LADPLATLLVQEGAVSLEALVQAQARQRELGGGLDTALLELGLVSEERLRDALARASGLPLAPPEALLEPDPRSRHVFPSRVAERHGLAPFRLEGRELHLAAAWPVDLAALDEISFMISLALVPHVAPELRVRELRRRVYDAPLPDRYRILAARLAASPAATSPRTPAPAPEATPAPAARPVGWAPAAGWTVAPAPGGQPGPEPLAAALAQAVQEAAAALEEEAPVEPGPGAEERSRPPRWDLAAARSALAAASRRDEAVEAVLRYGRDFFEHDALLAVSRDRLFGHDALGEDPRARERARGVGVPVGAAGIFRAVIDSGGPYLGPPGQDAVLEGVVAGLGRVRPRTILLYPVRVRDRVVCVLYADNGEAPVSPRRVGDLLLLAGSLGGELERILRAGKGGAPAAGEPGAGPREDPGRAGAPGRPTDRDGTGDAEAGADEAVEGRPPFDPVEATRRLAEAARGSAERGRLVAMLVQHGPEAAAALAAALPGPIDVPAAREESLPVDERGPVLAALAALGIVATPHLAAALRDSDPHRRRYAAMLLGQAADPAAFLGLADLAFDPVPAVGEAALQALERVRGHPDFRPVLERLRRALLAGTPGPAFAARALARLRDAGAVPGLISLLENSPGSADAAADALEALTARSFGRDAAAWRAWWGARRLRSRADWLLEALGDPDRAVRVAGAEALRALGPCPVAYSPEAPEPERRRAADEWRAWLESRRIDA
jgi:HEAT repeat protein